VYHDPNPTVAFGRFSYKEERCEDLREPTYKVDGGHKACVSKENVDSFTILGI
jgi:hypothetical protein